jgi:VIT1/CCC1 family predicted Fe2+/Mn2+ transporter
MTADDFAKNEYRDYITYKELANIETVPDFKKILQELTRHELGDYNFWLKFSSKKEHKISATEILFLKFLRKVLGLTFTAKFLERHEKEAIFNYKEFLKTAKGTTKEEIKEIIKHEKYHERQLIGQIKEEVVEFMSSIILGLNDGLIELSGALTGFAFAFRNNPTVLMAGLILGVAASLSMASSAYISARHEEGKDPKKSGLYTGFSYIVVVFLLISPFFFLPNIFASLITMIFVAFLIIICLSYYTSILFDRDFRKSLVEMLVFSMGIAFVSFLIGSAARVITGVEI